MKWFEICYCVCMMMIGVLSFIGFILLMSDIPVWGGIIILIISSVFITQSLYMWKAMNKK